MVTAPVLGTQSLEISGPSANFIPVRCPVEVLPRAIAGTPEVVITTAGETVDVIVPDITPPERGKYDEELKVEVLVVEPKPPPPIAAYIAFFVGIY